MSDISRDESPKRRKINTSVATVEIAVQLTFHFQYIWNLSTNVLDLDMLTGHSTRVFDLYSQYITTGYYYGHWQILTGWKRKEEINVFHGENSHRRSL